MQILNLLGIDVQNFERNVRKITIQKVPFKMIIHFILFLLLYKTNT